jgi:CubicO group peptidase (beta-lactamase class C family)
MTRELRPLDYKPPRPRRATTTRRRRRRRQRHSLANLAGCAGQFLMLLSSRGVILFVIGAFLLVFAWRGMPLLLGSSSQTGAKVMQKPEAAQLTPLPTITPTLPATAANALPPLEPPLPPGPTVSGEQPDAQGQPVLMPASDAPTAVPAHTGIVAPGATAAAIDSYINELVAQGQFSGAILVAHNGKVMLSQGYGMADNEQQIANTPQTRFRLASLTKPFTAIAVLMLHAEGKLNINDTVCLYIQPCPPAWQPVTIRHLLSHTSGIPNYTDFFDFELSEMQNTTPDELIGRFRNLPLNYEPGSMYYYNNSGYVLLGVIIERASGQSYEDFLRANIFEPLNMENTGYDHNVNFIHNQAIGYSTVGIEAPFIDVSTLHAAGSLYSTVEDMYRWEQALHDNYLLPRSLREEMFTPVHYGYGYGWRIGTLFNRPAMSHPGFINGFSNYMVRFPTTETFIIVCSNLEVAPAQSMAQHIASLIFQPPEAQTPPPPPLPQP